MAKHTNPRRDRRNRDGKFHRARAPYNFVPLPEKMVEATYPPDQDRYHADTYTGWIDCTLETRSPTYVRGMMNSQSFAESGRNKPEDLTPEHKEERASFFSSSDRKVGGQNAPVIPGSTIRGMVRGLMEIAAHGRMRWVADAPAMMFRAVAAASNDPLRDPYNAIIGRMASNVEAGYLYRDGDDWWIVPARRWPTGEPFIRVKDSFLQKAGIPGYLHFNHRDYKPQIHRLSCDAEVKSGKRGRYVAINKIGPARTHKVPVFLVCSGNMKETNEAGQPSPRARQVLLLFPDKQVNPLKIRPEAVKDYLENLTPFQRDELSTSAHGKGALQHEKPIFFVREQGSKEVTYFGHSPNFRIPARINGKDRAASPKDFVPAALRAVPQPDLVEAIFGWVVDDNEPPLGEGQRAGRVFFSDAQCTTLHDDIWYSKQPITPHVLASPKPTTFQHYLIQDEEEGHDPDDKKTLAHYGTSPEETDIRGYKMYWHRGHGPSIETSKDEKEQAKHATQLTKIRPLKAGVQFTCRIHFENLRREELGALLWVLAPAGDERHEYCHKLGMGKPLGMGAIKITPTLHLTDRQQRYHDLFDDGERWHTAAGKEEETTPFTEAFERFVLQQLGRAGGETRLRQLERIRMLLAMMQWREGDAAWLEETRYMEIEHGPGKVNEYKERPVLPDPLEVSKRYPR